MQGGESRSVSAFLFKNGFGLTNETRETTLGVREFLLEKLPSAKPTHGSLWVQSEDFAVEELAWQKSTILEERPALTVLEILEANTGNTVTVTLSGHREPVTQTGKVLGIPRWEKDQTLGRTQTAAFFNLEQEEGEVLSIPLSSVMNVRGKGLRYQFKEKKDAAGLLLRVKPVRDSGPAAWQYHLRMIVKGLTWAPSYKCSLDPAGSVGSLEIEGHACILNDAYDCDTFNSLNLLAGVPNIAFQNVQDPLTSMQEVDEFLSCLSGGGGGGSMHNRAPVLSNFMSNRMDSNVMSQQLSSGAGGGGGASDTNVDDIHAYRFSNVHCGKGQRVSLPLFSPSTVKYRDVHEAEIQNCHARTHGVESSEIDVFHSVRFENRSAAPFTTGPVLVTRGREQLVCQSTVLFTPIGHEVQLKLTKAIGVRLMHNETIERTSTSKTIFDQQYLQTIASGALVLKNHKATEVKLTIKLKLVGVLSESSIKPTANDELASLDMANSLRQVVFEVTLAPGKEDIIKYKRKYWVR